jgi:hypothetical protein
LVYCTTLKTEAIRFSEKGKVIAVTGRGGP